MKALILILLVQIGTAKMLDPCPNKPNCVSSLESGDKFIEPIEVSVNDNSLMQKMHNFISKMNRVEILSFNDNYLHAVFQSKYFKFKDDVEFVYDHDNGLVHIRSASRAGYYDFKTNRNRLESLRAEIEKL